MLFSPYVLGQLALPNRIVMPPMTRSRAASGEVATALMAEYYSQRAGAGLIVSEGTQISRQGQGYAWTPGIHSAEQVAGWRQVTDAVHAAGGRIFAQLWHVGRVSHTSLQPGNAAPVSSSALVAEGVKVFVDPQGRGSQAGGGEMVQHSAPRALTVEEIREIVADYAQAARNALDAGFDGVELHGANGYLINQFIDSQANARNDQYGGSLENRLRFLREVAEAVTAVVGRERIGVRLAPLTTLQGAVDDTRKPPTCRGAATGRDRRGLHPHRRGRLGRRPGNAGGIQGGVAHRLPWQPDLLRPVHQGARRGSPGQGLGRPDRLRPAVHRQP